MHENIPDTGLGASDSFVNIDIGALKLHIEDNCNVTAPYVYMSANHEVLKMSTRVNSTVMGCMSERGRYMSVYRLTDSARPHARSHRS